MATQCRGTKTKRINRHKLAVIQAYIIIGTLVLIGFIGGLVVGRATAPKKQVTVTETVEVPSYEADSLPVAEEVTYFDVPLSHSLQRYIYEVCADENVPVSLIRRCLRFRTLRPGSFCMAQTTDTSLLTSVPATRKCSLTALSQKPHTTFGLRGSAVKITESLC